MHECKPDFARDGDNCDGYGAAIIECTEDKDGKYWVGNEEYCSRVNYCPFCGAKAPQQIVANAGV